MVPLLKTMNKKAELASKAKESKKTSSVMENLMSQNLTRPIPKVGDLVEGKIISFSKNEVHLDIDGLTTGVVRGKEVYDESNEYSNIKENDIVIATVLEIENENGEMELSFRHAGHQKAWSALEDLMNSKVITAARIMDANKGGLMIKVGNVQGFLPVSQLTTEHYPRVDGGDKQKILACLKRFVGEDFKVKIIDVNEAEEKLIVSEKAAWEEKQTKTMSNYTVGDVVEGKITGVVNFGAFMEFGPEENTVEGLIHISELAWQRIDDPKQVVNVGDKVRAEIISIDNSKISLSLKKLIEDPWKDVAQKYKIGQKVKGQVIKLNPFGAFVELDKDIHGLIHVSELSSKKDDKKDGLVEGNEYEFYIISLEPRDHRLGLSLKKPEAKKESSSAEATEDKKAEVAEVVAETPVEEIAIEEPKE